MKRIWLLLMVLTFILLTGCGAKPEWQAALKEKVLFSEGKKVPLIIEVKNQGKPVSGLLVKAVLEMKKMDHGTMEVALQDIGEGVYREVVDLPMGGEWVANIKMSDGRQTSEEMISFRTEKEGHK